MTREELALALAGDQARKTFAKEHRISDAALDGAVRAGLGRAIDDAQHSGAISSLEAALLRRARDALPVRTIIHGLQTKTGKGVLGLLTDLLRGGP